MLSRCLSWPLAFALAIATPTLELHAQRTTRDDVVALGRETDSLARVERQLARRELALEVRLQALKFTSDSLTADARGWTLTRRAPAAAIASPARGLSSRTVLVLGFGVVGLNRACTPLLCDRDTWRGARPPTDAYTAAHALGAAALTSAQIAAGISPARAAATTIVLGAAYEASQGHVAGDDLAINSASAIGSALLLHWIRRH